MLRRSWPWQWFSMLWLNLKFISLEYRDWILQNKANSLIKSCELIYHFSVSYCVFSSFFFRLQVVCQQRRVALISNQFSFANLLPREEEFQWKSCTGFFILILFELWKHQLKLSQSFKMEMVNRGDNHTENARWTKIWDEPKRDVKFLPLCFVCLSQKTSWLNEK